MTKTLRNLQKALQDFRMLLPDGTLNHLYVFLEVARHSQDIETRELPDMLDMTQTTINRTLHTLAEGSYLRSRGLELLKVSVHPADARQRLVELTPKGRAFAKKLEETLNG
jgi:DNA-binding MarR family transcriptional regulator